MAEPVNAPEFRLDSPAVAPLAVSEPPATIDLQAQLEEVLGRGLAEMERSVQQALGQARGSLMPPFRLGG